MAPSPAAKREAVGFVQVGENAGLSCRNGPLPTSREGTGCPPKTLDQRLRARASEASPFDELPTRYGGHDRERLTVDDDGVETTKQSRVFVVDEQHHKAPETPVLVENARFDAGV